MTTVRYQLTVREVVAGFLKYRRMRGRIWMGIGIFVLGVLTIIYSQQYRFAASQAALFAGYAFVGLGLSLSLLTTPGYRRAFAKAVRANPFFTEERAVSFGEDGMVFSSPSRKSEVGWSVFKRITEDERYVYLHTDDLGTVTLLPKHAFGAGDMETFQRCSQSVPRA